MGMEEDYKEMRKEFHRILDKNKVSKKDQKKLVSLSAHMDHFD